MLDRNVALTAIDIMKGVLTGGTARGSLADFASRRPAFGKTGTQQSNWTAFFVGATPELATAVMVRDPDRYTPMVNIPEFVEAGVSAGPGRHVPGARSGARTWSRSRSASSASSSSSPTGTAPSRQPRDPARLYLPGSECLYEVVGYEAPPTTTADRDGATGRRA